MTDRSVFLGLAVAWAIVLPTGSPRAETPAGSTDSPAMRRPEIFLTWNAPFGSPRATDELRRGCSNEDSSHPDTLYLSYRLRESKDELTGIEASLFIHAQFTDTLSGAWDSADFTKMPSWLRADFPSEDEAGFRAGWQSIGLGFPIYFKEKSRAILRAVYAVRADRAAPIQAGPVYTFVRFIIDRHSPEFAGCDQGLCIEWADAVFSFGIGKAVVRGELGRRCFVSINSPQGLACTKYRQKAQRRGYLTAPPKPGVDY